MEQRYIKLFSLNEDPATLQDEIELKVLSRLKKRGFHGDISIISPLKSFDEFNADFKALTIFYNEFIANISWLKNEIENSLNRLYVIASELKIEPRHFKFQPQNLQEEFQKFKDLLENDFGLLRQFHPDLLVESLDAFFTNRQKLGYDVKLDQIPKIDKLLRRLNHTSDFLLHFMEIFKGKFTSFIKDRQVLRITFPHIAVEYNIRNLREVIIQKMSEISQDSQTLRKLEI